MTPRQIDNSVSVSCDVAAVARFFCLGFIGRASKVAQNISNKPYPYPRIITFADSNYCSNLVFTTGELHNNIKQTEIFQIPC